MRTILSVFSSCLIFTVISCNTAVRENTKREKADRAEFKAYTDSLETLTLPLYLPYTSTFEQKFDDQLFKKFKTTWADKPLGKIILSTTRIMVLENQTGSSNAPILVVYDRNGQKLDSLYVFKNADTGTDFETTESADIKNFDDIHITTITEKWLLDPDSARVNGTRRVFTDTSVVYTVDPNGKFFGFQKINFQSPYNQVTTEPIQFLCGFGKSIHDFNQAKNKADKFVHAGKTVEALELMLPTAFDKTFGLNGDASNYCALLAQTLSRKNEMNENLKAGLESIRLEKRSGMYGETHMLQMTLFGAEFILPDSYYWLGAPSNKENVRRQDVDVNLAITKTKNSISESMLYKLLRQE